MEFDAHRGWWTAVVLFGYNGIAIGSYAGALATFHAHFGLEPLRVSVLFIAAGIAAITAMQVGGRLADRYGVRQVALLSVIPQLGAALAFAFVPSYAWLLAAVFCFGVGNGGLDVAMNLLGVEVEKQKSSPVLSFLHGVWALGNTFGAGSLFIVAAISGLSPYASLQVVQVSVAALGVGVLMLGYRIIPQTQPRQSRDATGKKLRIPAAAYLLGLMAIAAGIGEGTGMDWSGIHVATVAQIDPSQAALAVAAYGGTMTVIRLVGDLLVLAIGRRLLVRLGAACAICGYVIVATSGDFLVLLAGWALVGLGMGVVAPQVYAIAGHLAGGKGLAVAVTFGYAAMLTGPAIMGGFITAVGIQPAMFFPPVLLLSLLVLARLLPSRAVDDNQLSGIG
ncbi:MAG: MFS transporter [Propionibacteriaceae bacterium]|nr:MFS transporter [Propionibacteriaceae bacterium]